VKDGTADAAGPFLAERAPCPGDVEVYRVYRPFSEYTGLFRDFADVQATHAGVLAFANRHGNLGFSRTIDPKDLPKGAVLGFGGTIAKPGHSVPAEAFRDWVLQIRAMKKAVGAWDAVAQRDAEKLSSMVVWRKGSDGHTVLVRTGNAIIPRTIIAGPRYRPELLEHMKPGDLLAPTQYYLQELVNKALQTHNACARLLWNRHQQLDVIVAPSGLIGAMWLQLALAIEGNHSYQTCEQCRRWFEVGVEVRRGAKFCSEACRQKHKRARIAAARTLYAEKVSLEEIATQLGTDVETVKGWVR
jgi:hypothetical protein